jgi:hypothetical protein
VTYDPQGENANDVHENVTTLTQDDSVQGNEGLGRAKAHESRSVRL